MFVQISARVMLCLNPAKRFSGDPLRVPEGYVRCTTLNRAQCTNAFPFVPGSRITRCEQCRESYGKSHAKQESKPIKSIVVPDGHVRCSRTKRSWQCTNTFVFGADGSNSKRCVRCRQTTKRDNDSFAGVVRLQKYAGGAKSKIAKRRYECKVMTKIGHGLRDQLSGRERPAWLKDVSERLAPVTEFQDEADARAHFERQFEDWMNWENAGVYRRGQSYQTVWHIGHRIPRNAYDQDDEEDMRRCWSKANLYPQDGKDNVEKQTQLPAKEALWLLKNVWPKRWSTSPPPLLC